MKATHVIEFFLAGHLRDAKRNAKPFSIDILTTAVLDNFNTDEETASAIARYLKNKISWHACNGLMSVTPKELLEQRYVKPPYDKNDVEIGVIIDATVSTTTEWFHIIADEYNKGYIQALLKHASVQPRFKIEIHPHISFVCPPTDECMMRFTCKNNE